MSITSEVEGAVRISVRYTDGYGNYSNRHTYSTIDVDGEENAILTEDELYKLCTEDGIILAYED